MYRKLKDNIDNIGIIRTVDQFDSFVNDNIVVAVTKSKCSMIH